MFRGRYTIVATLKSVELQNFWVCDGLTTWHDASCEEKVHNELEDITRQVVIKRFGERYRAFYKSWMWDYDGQRFSDVPWSHVVKDCKRSWSLVDCFLPMLTRQRLFPGEIPDEPITDLTERDEKHEQVRLELTNFINSVPQIDIARRALTNPSIKSSRPVIQDPTKRWLSWWAVERNDRYCPRCDGDFQGFLKDAREMSEHVLKNLHCYHCIKSQLSVFLN